MRSCGLGAAALRRMPPASEEFPEAVLPPAARCAPGQIAPAHPGWPSVSSSEVSPAVSRGPHPRAGEKGQCGSKHGLCLLHTDVEEPVKKLPPRSVFQQRQSCGTRAPLQFADKDEAAC